MIKNMGEFTNKVDAMVVPANKKAVVGRVLDFQMYKAAGFDEVMTQRKAMGELHIGQAKETDGFAIAKYLIHTATPMWLGGTSHEREKLKSCYINSIKCADRLGLKIIAFPLLSSGSMGFPRGTAYETAFDAINERLSVHDSMDVYLVMLDDASDEFMQAENIYEHRDSTMEELIKMKRSLSEYQDPDREIVWYLKNVTDHIAMKAAEAAQKKSFEAARGKYPDKDVNDLKRELFYKYFDKCGLTSSELADKIGCDKSTVTRIRSGDTKKPQKKRVIALAIAMELSAEERYDLIRCSGNSYPVDEMDYAIEQFMRDGYRKLSNISDMLYKRNKNRLLVGNKNDELPEKKEHSKER